MKSVFVSYRHEEPDEQLAAFLADHLRNSYQVFIDADIDVGQDWISAIETALSQSECLVVLLSKKSIGSDMVRHEVNLAHKQKKYILPILIDFNYDELPYDLGAYLHRPQSLRWNSTEDRYQLATRISKAIRKSGVPGVTQAPDITYAGIEEADAPLPSADPRYVANVESGTIQLDSSFYVRRATDAEAEHCVKASVPTIIIKAPRQMGKSSLLARLHAQAQKSGGKSVYLDFQLVDASHLTDLNGLFRYLARQFQRAFATIDPKQVWDDFDGPKGNITNYIEDAVLASSDLPVYLIFDEVERLFEVPYRDEFFSAVRGWHNLRATNLRFTKLRIVIAHATTPTLWISDINQSPFNVGQSITLRGFNEKQVAELNTKYGSPLRDANEIKELVKLVDGHAYLTRLALHKLSARNYSFSELVQSVDDQGGPFSDHLLGIRWILNKAPELRESLQRILLGQGCDDEMHYQRLWAVGLICGRTRMEAAPSCRLYEEYFRRHL